MAIKFEKIHEDKRGCISRFLFEGKEYLIIFTRKGFARGGDYHKSKQYDIILMGKMKFRYKNQSWNVEHEEILKTGQIISFEPNMPHLFIAEEDALLVEWLEGEFEKSFYEPYRKLVK